MGTDFANKAIECSIDNCVNHCTNAQFCSLQKISVGTHESNPTQVACTDCMSFQKK